MANVTQIRTEEIFMEGDSTTTVETLVLCESVNLQTEPEGGEFTPCFGPLFRGQIGETE